jgi:hypothetical protein
VPGDACRRSDALSVKKRKIRKKTFPIGRISPEQAGAARNKAGSSPDQEARSAAFILLSCHPVRHPAAKPDHPSAIRDNDKVAASIGGHGVGCQPAIQPTPSRRYQRSADC